MWERLDGLRLRRVGEIPRAVLREAIAAHRANAARGRDACEHWGPASSVSRVILVTDDGSPLDLAVKWNHPRGWRRALVERLRGSRAERADRGARALARAGIDHPATLAIAVDRRGGLVRESFLVTPFLADAEPLPALMPELREDRSRRRAVARAMGAVIGRLHALGLDHRDLKHSNLLVRSGGGIALLDLDSLIPPRAPGARARARALGQLEAYAVDLYPWLPASDRARFLHAYLEENPGWHDRRHQLVAEARAWAERRLASWARKDRSDHYHFPMAPRDAHGRGR